MAKDLHWSAHMIHVTCVSSGISSCHQVSVTTLELAVGALIKPIECDTSDIMKARIRYRVATTNICKDQSIVFVIYFWRQTLVTEETLSNYRLFHGTTKPCDLFFRVLHITSKINILCTTLAVLVRSDLSFRGLLEFTSSVSGASAHQEFRVFGERRFL